MNTIILTPQIEKTISEAANLNKQIRENTKFLDLYKKQIINEYFMKDFGVIVLESSGLIVCEHKRISREVLDTKRLQEELPHVYEEYKKVSVYGQLGGL